MAEHGHGRLVLEFRHHLATLGNDFAGVLGLQAHQMLAVGAGGVGARQRPLTQEILLLLADDPVHAQILRRHRAVGFLARR